MITNKIKTAKMLALITEIHSAFDNSSIELYQRSLSKLNELSSLVEKSKLLRELGFVSAKNIHGEDWFRLAETVVYYAQKYPDMKFLTQDIFDSICKKYRLTVGSIENYTGDVPLDNLLEMKGKLRKIEEKDRAENIMSITFIPDDFDNVSESTTILVESRPYSVLKLEEMAGSLGYEYPSLTKRRISEIVRSEMMIACDRKLLKKKGYKVLNKTVINPDPIVFVNVKGGLLILSKWGKEAIETQLSY
jgi:hypothetical protein